jgi:hypothetical protein
MTTGKLHWVIEKLTAAKAGVAIEIAIILEESTTDHCSHRLKLCNHDCHKFFFL